MKIKDQNIQKILITTKYELFFIIKYIENIFKNIYVAVIFGLNINN